MIIVIETWLLKPGLSKKTREIMQKMDDLLGPDAHKDPGWLGHARFFQSSESPDRVLMIYPWLSRELHAQLAIEEESRLEEFYREYCLAPRTIHYYDELEVEVEHD